MTVSLVSSAHLDLIEELQVGCLWDKLVDCNKWILHFITRLPQFSQTLMRGALIGMDQAVKLRNILVLK